MKKIIGGRFTGKTRELLHYAKENEAIVVCGNPSAMATKARAYGIIGLEFMSYSDYIGEEIEEILLNGVPEDYVIDDIDALLKEFKIIGFTSTVEE